jgi:NAD(P)-dependent dehydrogenase (short-subunit alcohol dehydrogenase family)
LDKGQNEQFNEGQSRTYNRSQGQLNLQRNYNMLTDQKIAIVGGTAGIGLALARMAADAGAEVRLGGSSRDKLDQALRLLNGNVRGELVDAGDEDSIQRFFVQAGELDHVVSTIGSASRAARVRDGRRADYEKLFTIKYWGQFLIAKHSVEQLSANGSITLTSGVLSQRPAEGFSVLASVNAGVEAMARTLALEFAPRRVNVVCPGFVDTGKLHADLPAETRTAKLQAEKADILPSRRIGLPEDVARAYIHALENPYLTGQTLVVDGGASLI